MDAQLTTWTSQKRSLGQIAWLNMPVTEVHNVHQARGWLAEKGDLVPQLPNTTRWISHMACIKTCLKLPKVYSLQQARLQQSYHWSARQCWHFKRNQQQHTQPFYGPLSGTTRVSRYQKKHPPTHHPEHHPIFISFFHLLQSIASSLVKLCAWQYFRTTSLHVLFGLPLGLEPSTSYSTYISSPNQASFCSTCTYLCNMFCCSINIISSIPTLSLNSLLGTLSFTLTLHIHLTILISARWSATSFSFLTGQVSLPCSILLHTQLLYSLPLLITDISLLVSNGTNCLNLVGPESYDRDLRYRCGLLTATISCHWSGTTISSCCDNPDSD